jgi:hypothetical protein
MASETIKKTLKQDAVGCDAIATRIWSKATPLI